MIEVDWKQTLDELDEMIKNLISLRKMLGILSIAGQTKLMDYNEDFFDQEETTTADEETIE
jgi:hypothetical protein